MLLAADRTAIHTFGWPVGVVLHVDGKKPEPFKIGNDAGIKVMIASSEHTDYWTLTKKGEYYILMSLFEDQRSEKKIFIDTRTIRITEYFLRTAKLYQALGVPSGEGLMIRIEHGGLKGRILSAANSLRAWSIMEDRKCSENIVLNVFEKTIADCLNLSSLQEMVYEVIKSITEMCNMFVPDKKRVTDPIVESFLQGKII